VRAVVAKRLRRKIYGKGTHPGVTLYFVAGTSKTMPKNLRGCCIADQARRNYQWTKKRYIMGLS
jgi:hypothetical protein